jgi:hypothetical protein
MWKYLWKVSDSRTGVRGVAKEGGISRQANARWLSAQPCPPSADAGRFAAG